MKKLIAVLMVATLVGCATTPTQKIIQSEGIIITTVDTGMSIWANYVQQHQTDGKVTQTQIDRIHTGYDAYYAAQQSAKAAIEMYMVQGSTNSTDVVTADIAVQNAEMSLINVLNQYLISTK